MASEFDEEGDDLELDDDPIPAKRDTTLFTRKKEQKKEDEDFEEDVFV